MKTVILHATVTRDVNATEDIVTYQMSKQTPYGMLTSTETVSLKKFYADGPAVVDHEALNRLSFRLNQQENDRLLEIAANANFGV